MPLGFVGELKLKVIARDSKGNEVSTIFRFTVGKKREAGKAPTGRASLSDQLRSVGLESVGKIARVDSQIANDRYVKKAARV